MNVTRRAVLGAATAVGIGVAGCLGGEESTEATESTEPPAPPVAGDPDADVTVTVYEDFACGGCANFKRNQFPQIEAQYIDPGEIRYEHRDFPIPVDETWSWAVASAGRELYEEEGDDAFFSFASEIYSYHPSYSYDAIEAVATELGFDGSTARRAAEELTHEDSLDADRSLGESDGVGGTPSVFVDGELLEDPFAGWQPAIEGALE